MADYPRNFTLKNGREVTLKPLEKGDKEALYNFFKRLPEQDRLYFKNDVTDKKLIDQWLDKIDLAKVFPLIAWYGNEIVADATLHMHEHGWSRHIGELRCAIAKDFQHIGLGTIMVAELVQVASSKGLSRLETQFMSGQTGAIKAFSRAGFKQEAILKDRVKDLKGKLHDKVIMTNDVDAIWETMENLIIDVAVPESRSGY